MARAWFSAAMAGMALLAMTFPAHAADTIKFGVPGAHSGDLASYGLPGLNAARIVVDEYNAKGGLLGKQIEIITQDDQCKPELGASAATKLLSEGAVVIMGTICSGATKAALPVYTKAKIVSISPAATTAELTNGDNPYFFRTIASDATSGNLAAAFAEEKLGAKKIALIHDNGDYGRGFINFAKDHLTKSNKAQIVLEDGISAGTPDYSGAIQKIQNSGAEVVIYGGYHPDAWKIVQQMNKKGLKVKFIGPDGVKDDQFIKSAGADAEGVYATGPKDVSKLPANIEAHKNHRDRFNSEAGTFYDNAYSATIVLLEAIKKAGSTDTDLIVEALRTNPVETPIGTIKFDSKGDAEGAGFSVYEVKGGQFVEVK